jgi:hypothetical protein
MIRGANIITVSVFYRKYNTFKCAAVRLLEISKGKVYSSVKQNAITFNETEMHPTVDNGFLFSIIWGIRLVLTEQHIHRCDL